MPPDRQHHHPRPLLKTLLSPLLYLYDLVAAMLRKLISSPRNRHSDPLSSTSLDLAYLTPNLIVMSTPASTFPKTLWRNPTDDVRKFLDANHPGKWRVWSLRGEGHDYLDHDLDGKVEHFGWPDHHPPPFEYIDPLLTSIHNFLTADQKATAVLHCKAGKGRSGTIAVSYLVTYDSWVPNKALKHFTTQRMRYGEGVSIASQRRWVRYVDFWAHTLERKYRPRNVEVVKIEFWGMKLGDGGDKLEVGIARFVEGKYPDCKAVEKIHVFEDDERIVRGEEEVVYTPKGGGVRTTSDVNMFLTRHRLLHTSVPRVPMSISHCWINTELERAKLEHGDHGYKDPATPVPVEEVEEAKPLTEDILPDMFKTKPNLDRKASEPADHTSLNSETTSSVSTPQIPTPARANGTTQPIDGGDLFSRVRRKSTGSSSVVVLKDRDWRGQDEDGGLMWWECQWEGMDGIGGTNKKGRKCFDRVRIWWRDLPEQEQLEQGSKS